MSDVVYVDTAVCRSDRSGEALFPQTRSEFSDCTGGVKGGVLRFVIASLEVAATVVRPALGVMGEVPAQDLGDVLFLACRGIGEADFLLLAMYRPEPRGAHLALHFLLTQPREPGAGEIKARALKSLVDAIQRLVVLTYIHQQAGQELTSARLFSITPAGAGVVTSRPLSLSLTQWTGVLQHHVGGGALGPGGR